MDTASPFDISLPSWSMLLCRRGRGFTQGRECWMWGETELNKRPVVGTGGTASFLTCPGFRFSLRRLLAMEGDT